MRPSYRFATERDAPALRRLFEEVVTDLTVYCESMREEQLDRYTEAHMETLVTAHEKAVVVAEVAGQIQGFISVTNQGGPGWIDWLIVAEKHRQQGIGRELITRAMYAAPDRGIHKLWADSRIANEPMFKLFKHMDFIIKAELKDHWHRQDYYIWQKFIR
jgi:RimJ/RimL family protein N-acetyltransferase